LQIQHELNIICKQSELNIPTVYSATGNTNNMRGPTVLVWTMVRTKYIGILGGLKNTPLYNNELQIYGLPISER